MDVGGVVLGVQGTGCDRVDGGRAGAGDDGGAVAFGIDEVMTGLAFVRPVFVHNLNAQKLEPVLHAQDFGFGNRFFTLLAGLHVDRMNVRFVSDLAERAARDRVDDRRRGGRNNGGRVAFGVDEIIAFRALGRLAVRLERLDLHDHSLVVGEQYFSVRDRVAFEGAGLQVDAENVGLIAGLRERRGGARVNTDRRRRNDRNALAVDIDHLIVDASRLLPCVVGGFDAENQKRAVVAQAYRRDDRDALRLVQFTGRHVDRISRDAFVHFKLSGSQHGKSDALAVFHDREKRVGAAINGRHVVTQRAFLIAFLDRSVGHVFFVKRLDAEDLHAAREFGLEADQRGTLSTVHAELAFGYADDECRMIQRPVFRIDPSHVPQHDRITAVGHAVNIARGVGSVFGQEQFVSQRCAFKGDALCVRRRDLDITDTGVVVTDKAAAAYLHKRPALDTVSGTRLVAGFGVGIDLEAVTAYVHEEQAAGLERLFEIDAASLRKQSVGLQASLRVEMVARLADRVHLGVGEQRAVLLHEIKFRITLIVDHGLAIDEPRKVNERPLDHDAWPVLHRLAVSHRRVVFIGGLVGRVVTVTHLRQFILRRVSDENGLRIREFNIKDVAAAVVFDVAGNLSDFFSEEIFVPEQARDEVAVGGMGFRHRQSGLPLFADDQRFEAYGRALVENEIQHVVLVQARDLERRLALHMLARFFFERTVGDRDQRERLVGALETVAQHDQTLDIVLIGVAVRLETSDQRVEAGDLILVRRKHHGSHRQTELHLVDDDVGGAGFIQKAAVDDVVESQELGKRGNLLTRVTGDQVG